MKIDTNRNITVVKLTIAERLYQIIAQSTDLTCI